MTARQFIEWVQKYYGAYPEGQKANIAEWLRSKDPAFLDALEKEVCETYTSSYGKPPDVAALVKCSRTMAIEYPLIAALEPPGSEYVSLHDMMVKDAISRGIDPNSPNLFKLLVEARVKKHRAPEDDIDWGF